MFALEPIESPYEKTCCGRIRAATGLPCGGGYRIPSIAHRLGRR